MRGWASWVGIVAAADASEIAWATPRHVFRERRAVAAGGAAAAAAGLASSRSAWRRTRSRTSVVGGESGDLLHAQMERHVQVRLDIVKLVE